MPKTMNKDDVLLREPFDRFNVNSVKDISGKAAPSAVVNALKDLKRAKKAGEVKKPEIKIGKIDGHLYLRIKDGNDHLDDFLLAKNFTGDGDDAPVRDRAYMQKVAQYRDIRMDAFNQLVAGEKDIKARLGELEEMLERAQDHVRQAQNGTYGYGNPGQSAQELLKEAIKRAKEIDDVFDDEVHAPFDTHRDYKKPKEVEAEDVAEWGRPFYLSQWRPKYGKAKENVKLSKTVVQQIRVAAKNAINFTERADDALANYRSMAAELVALAEAEVSDARAVWGLQAPDTVAEAFKGDADRIRALKPQNLDPAQEEKITKNFLNTSSERMVALNNGMNRLKKHVRKQAEIATRFKAIPKEMLKDREIKSQAVALKQAVKSMQAYEKTVAGDFKAAVSAFKKTKELAAAG